MNAGIFEELEEKGVKTGFAYSEEVAFLAGGELDKSHIMHLPFAEVRFCLGVETYDVSGLQIGDGSCDCFV